MSKSVLWLTLTVICLLLPLSLLADQVVMSNGDTYNGTVLSLTTNVLVLKNDNLGKVTLLRSKVAAITFGNTTVTVTANPQSTNTLIPKLAASFTNSVAPTVNSLRGIASQSNVIQQVESQFLASAGPDAVNKFNDLLGGLDSGKIDMNGLRSQAQSAADQLRALKKDLGSDSDDEINTYLTILDNFLAETGNGNGSTNTNANSTAP
jgi:hypothetical protein